MTSRVSKKNRQYLNQGHIERDATHGTEIVNFRTLRGNTVSSVNVVTTSSGKSLLEGGATTDPGPIVEVRSLVAGDFISFVVDNDTITINNTSASGGTVTEVQSAVTPNTTSNFSLLRFNQTLDTGPVVSLRSLRAVENLTLTEAADTITIDGVATVGTGTTTTVQSAGTGRSLLQDGVDELSVAAINLKTLVAGPNVTIVPNVDNTSLIISSTAGTGGGTLTEFQAPVGTGGATLLEGIGTTSDINPIIDLKSLSEGANITFTTTADTIQINAVGTGGGGTVTTVNAVGGGESLLAGGIPSDPGPAVNLRSLVAGNNVVITEGQSSVLTISVPSVESPTTQIKTVLSVGDTQDTNPFTPLRILVFVDGEYIPGTDYTNKFNPFQNAFPRFEEFNILDGKNFKRLVSSFAEPVRKYVSINTPGVISGTSGVIERVGSGFQVLNGRVNFRIEVNVRALISIATPDNRNNMTLTTHLLGGIRKIAPAETSNYISTYRIPGPLGPDDPVDPLTDPESDRNRIVDAQTTILREATATTRSFTWLHGTFVLYNKTDDFFEFNTGDVVVPYLMSYSTLVPFKGSSTPTVETSYISFRVVEL